jgi:hypothetical protein
MAALSKSVKQVALPAEHGGWGFWLEPALLGMLVASSVARLWLVIGSLGALLVRQPMKIAILDYKRGRVFERTRLAWRFIVLYGGIAALCVVLAVANAGSELLAPILGVAPLAAIHIVYDAQNQSRRWLPEVLGPIVMSSTAVSIAVAGGWTLAAAVPLAVIIVVRAVSSVLYVRERIRAEKKRPYNALLPLMVHGLALAILTLMAAAGAVPWLSVIGAVILLARAAHGLSRYRRPTAVKVIGFQEMGLGLMTVFLAAVGYSMM